MLSLYQLDYIIASLSYACRAKNNSRKSTHGESAHGSREGIYSQGLQLRARVYREGPQR